MKMPQKGKVVLNVALSTCAIIIILSGMALAADRDVIIGYHKPVVGVSAKELVVQSHSGKVKKDFHLINAVSARIPEDKIEEIKKDPRVAYIVNDTIFRMTDEYSSSWGVQYIGSEPVHNQSINGTGVKIAVLDTGIDYNHPDLAGNYKGGYDFVNNYPDPRDDNCLSYYKTCHGTHVSGIIAAEHNGIGVVGVAPGASIYAVKVLDGGGFGDASWIISGIEWAKDNGMNIISMSFGSTENNTAVLDAVNSAYDSGVLLVAAGGNTNGRPVLYPAGYDSVIAVTAIDQNGQNASFSPKDQKIEVAAPGVNINSTVQGGYGILSGTSMAAPHVTGVAALIFSTNFPDVNGDGKRDNKDVRQIIDSTAFDAGIPGKDDIYGYGIVDASKALLGTSASAYASASANADLSITEDEAVSNIIAGDGKTYTYIITVKNNGPSDASGVQVFDTWPSGFIRGPVTSSQGTCDTAINFTCDLGTMSRDGTANINVSYTVPNTTIGNYTNRVEVKSTSADNDVSNNIAEDKNIVEIILNLVVKERSSSKNAKQVSLLKGDYSITITNSKLSEIDVNVYENGVLRKDLSSKYKLKKSQVVNFNMNIESPKLDFVFIPNGDKGSTGTITNMRSS
ncbi:MAG: S8 family serine peptidase [Candidatus Methanoperedens sp.]|nr:S8 family serine peptidase [Candidatus Methanoperedens sp.]